MIDVERATVHEEEVGKLISDEELRKSRFPMAKV